MPTPVAVSLEGALAFRDPVQCVPALKLEAIYSALDERIEKPGTQGELTPPEFPVPLLVSAKDDVDARGVRTIKASARPSRPTRWNSLRLLAISASSRRPPESDSIYTRMLTFRDPPAKVLQVLNRLGFRTKAAPGYSRLTADGDECGGAMKVAAAPGGAALVCEWGC